MLFLVVLLLTSAVLQVQAGVHQGNNRSETKCSEPCVNGICDSTGKCDCFTGYQFLNSSQTECEPICSEGCGVNGRCIAPGKCSCNEGFIINDSFTDCKPLCSKSCRNGICSGPNKCTCLEGYGELLWYYCVPLCPKSCLNGFCVAPNTCRCFPGYQPSPRLGLNICEPICSQNCGHGRCIAPEICRCDKGYAKSSAEGSCELQTGSDIITEAKSSLSSKKSTSEEPNSEAKSQILPNSDTDTNK